MAQINQAILTIAIPTFNRPGKIQTQVRLLLPQLNSKVCLVVYDNYSDSPIKNYFSDDELSKFTLIRNRVNIGADANIAKCFENCSSKWLWTLSDDDFVRADVIKFILDILEIKSESVFLNFCKGNGISFKSTGFEELVIQFKNPVVFSSSFTMSSCIYNMEKIQPSLQDYFNNLSSMMGTIILILKYVQKNQDAVCEFIDETLIESYNDQVGWDYRVYIRRTRLFIEAFYTSENKWKFNKTLFLGCHLTNYTLLSKNINKVGDKYFEIWKYFFVALDVQGFLNALLFCPKTILRLLFDLSFGQVSLLMNKIFNK